MVVGDDHRITGRNDVIQVNEIRQRQHDRPENQRNDDASDTLPVKIPELRAYGKQQHPVIITNSGTQARTKLPVNTPVKNAPRSASNRATNGSQQCDKTTRKQATTRSRSIQPICSLPCISISKRIFENTIKNHAIARSAVFRFDPHDQKHYKINKSSDNIRHPTPFSPVSPKYSASRPKHSRLRYQNRKTRFVCGPYPDRTLFYRTRFCFLPNIRYLCAEVRQWYLP